MRVAVYAICKNESAFVERWMDSMKEADEIVVLDTGSTDDTAARLRARGAHVTVETIAPWRFDTARNRSLALVSEDAQICVCTDLDEVFRPGWRAALEDAWRADTQQARYRYTWRFQSDGSEGVVFWTEKAHSRHGWLWSHPVHEVLVRADGKAPRCVDAEGVQLNHLPDEKKSRSQYLPLLEWSVQEAPEDDRNVHYLGREYFFYGRWDDCIATLSRHLTMPASVWKDERAASMRYIGKAYQAKGDAAQARVWLTRAVTEAPHLREPYMDLAMMLYAQQDWHGVLYFTQQALTITERPRAYLCEASAWGSLPHDLRAVAFYYVQEEDALSAAYEEIQTAICFAPTDSRLRENLRWIEQRRANETGRGRA